MTPATPAPEQHSAWGVVALAAIALAALVTMAGCTNRVASPASTERSPCACAELPNLPFDPATDLPLS